MSCGTRRRLRRDLRGSPDGVSSGSMYGDGSEWTGLSGDVGLFIFQLTDMTIGSRSKD
jgi:hypothetical protein